MIKKKIHLQKKILLTGECKHIRETYWDVKSVDSSSGIRNIKSGVSFCGTGSNFLFKTVSFSFPGRAAQAKMDTIQCLLLAS